MITDNAVYSDEVTIEAPVELVWDILVDFERYDEWNRFCPSIANRALAVGEAVEMMVDLGQGPAPQVEYISRIEPGHCIAWAMENKPGDPVHAVRSQYLKPLDGARCSYQTVDEFAGPGMAAMMEHFAGAVEEGFNRCAYDLKARAEQLYRAGRDA